ncbi:MAG TPA: glycosyltransferase [Acidimicrobiales bacterium]|nr:glycosyltransferase [Acidimicrobiales bacterium]
MEIHQVLVTAAPADAITNAALEIQRLLHRIVPTSKVYARFIDSRMGSKVLPLSDYPRGSGRPGDVLLFHASIGEPDVREFLLERPEQLVLIYHNISPAQPFLEHDPVFAALLEGGRRELADLAARTRLALADSQFNADELVALGYEDVRVSPLIIDLTGLRRVPPDPRTEDLFCTRATGPRFLFVGQLLPHKRPDTLIKAFHILTTYLIPDAQIALVGAGRLPRYRRSLERFVQELNLPGVWLAGLVTDEQLVAFFRNADCFVTASEHEGFCVPVLEAMLFDVPVVARGVAALPETIGDAGLVLPPDGDATLLAEAMAVTVRDADLRSELVERGRRRLDAFSADRARTTFLENLATVV